MIKEYEKLPSLDKHRETKCLKDVSDMLEELEENMHCIDHGYEKVDETTKIITGIMEKGNGFTKIISNYIDELKKFDPEAAEYWESETIKNFGNHRER